TRNSELPCGLGLRQSLTPVRPRIRHTCTLSGTTPQKHHSQLNSVAVCRPSTTRRSHGGVAHRARASRDPAVGRPAPGARLRPPGSPKRAMLEGNRVSRISVRGFAVASATAVTAVGSVVGVASGSVAQNNDAEATADDATTLLADIPA